jgi:hypothetical protein
MATLAHISHSRPSTKGFGSAMLTNLKLVMVLATVFTFTCSNDSNDDTNNALVGTWFADNEPKYEITFKNNGSYEEFYNGSADARGTYSISGNSVTVQRNQIHGNGSFAIFASDLSLLPEWYTKYQLLEMGVEASLLTLFDAGTGTYTATENTFIITWDGVDITNSYTKKR